MFRFVANWYKKARVGFSEVVKQAEVKWSGRDGRDFAKEGYSENAIAFRCIDIIAKSLANIDLEVYVGEDRMDPEGNHPLVRLLAQPNPLQGGAQFVEALVAFRLITGNSYVEKLKPSVGAPREMYVWPPYHMKVAAPEGEILPTGYVWDDGTKRVGWEVDFVDGSSDILHWKTFNPLNHFYGMSPMSPAAKAVDQHNTADEWNMKMLQNSASPDGILTTPENSTLTDPQFKQLMERMRKSQVGPKNARKTMILEGGLRWQQTALSPKDMDWLAGKKLSATDIATTYGVPIQLLGIEGSQTQANYEQARLALYEDTSIPLMDNLVDELNRWLAPEFGDNVHIRYNKETIPALEIRRRERWSAVQTASWLTTNEKREATGYEKITDPAADEVLVPSGLLPLTFDSTQESEPSDEEIEEATNQMIDEEDEE